MSGKSAGGVEGRDPFFGHFDAGQWYAAYTCAQHEKAVSQQLRAKQIEVLLPTAPVERKWKDRTVRVETPIFRGYVFLRMRLQEKLKVLSIPSVVHLVSFNGKPAVIDSGEIESIRTCVTAGRGLRPHSPLVAGTRVRVKTGALQGVEGTLVWHEDSCKLVVSIRLLHQALAVDVDLSDVEAA